MDGISRLPEEVLGSILSLLTTKEAASTCVLSRKWRYVFRLVDHLDLDDHVWNCVEDGYNNSNNKPRFYAFPMNESFKSFVDRTLALQCDYPIKKFSLKCYVGNGSGRICVGRWISNVVQRGVLELDLTFKYRFNLSLPPELFTCKTLVKLTLGAKIFLGKIPSYVCLPSLKILLIHTTFFEYEDFWCRLLPGCPVLEELSVLYKYFAGTPHTISSQTVKRLTVDYFWRGGHDHMSFDLPNLVYFDYSDFALAEYDQVRMESLVEAKLNLLPIERVECPDVTDLIFGITSVEILHLSAASVDIIYACCKRGMSLPMFENLVNLSFGCKNKRAWELLSYLLKQSPKLATINILAYQEIVQVAEHLKSFFAKFKHLQVVRVAYQGEDDGGKSKRDLLMLLGDSCPSKCQLQIL